MDKRKYAFEELDDIANSSTRGRWSVDRVEVLKGAIRLAIKHAREDIREMMEIQTQSAERVQTTLRNTIKYTREDLIFQIEGPENEG